MLKHGGRAGIVGPGRWWSPPRPRSAPGREAGALVSALRGQAAVELLDGSTDAVLGMDLHATIVFANEVARRAFAPGGQNLVGQAIDRFVPRIARAVNALRLRLEAGGEAADLAQAPLELTGVRTDGTRFPVAVNLTPVRSGRSLVITATVRDLSAPRALAARTRRQSAEATRTRQELDVARDELTAVLRAVGERVIILADRNGVITAFNRAAERLLGYTAAEVIGRPTTVLSDPEDLAETAAELGLDAGVDPLLELSRSGLRSTQDWNYRSASGERRPVTLRISAVGDRRDPSGFVCVADERAFEWAPSGSAASGSSSADRLLLDLDDAETRSLRWQVGGSRFARRS